MLLDVAVREGVSTAVGVDKPVTVLVAEGLDVSLDVREMYVKDSRQQKLLGTMKL